MEEPAKLPLKNDVPGFYILGRYFLLAAIVIEILRIWALFYANAFIVPESAAKISALMPQEGLGLAGFYTLACMIYSLGILLVAWFPLRYVLHGSVFAGMLLLLIFILLNLFLFTHDSVPFFKHFKTITLVTIFISYYFLSTGEVIEWQKKRRELKRALKDHS